MPHSIQWYIEGQVLLVRFQGVMTVEDMEHYAVKLMTFYAQSDAPQVHALVDARYITKSLSVFELIKVVRKPVHPRMGWNIQVDLNQPLLRHLTNIVTQILHLPNRFYDTFDEGLAFLAVQDTTIRWELANLAVLNPDIHAET